MGAGSSEIRMRSSLAMRVCVLAAMLVVACACGASVRAGNSGLVAGDEGGGWFVAPFSGQGGLLFYLPAGGSPGSLVSALPLVAEPEEMASLDGRLVMIFDPVRSDPDDSRSLRQVREVRATPGPRAPMQFFSEPSPLPPIAESGAIEGLALTRDGPLVAMGPAQLNGPRRLLELGSAGWVDAVLPPGLDPTRAFDLLALDGAAAIVQEQSDAAARLWVRDQGAELGSTPGWRSDELGPMPAGARLLGAHGQILALAPEGSDQTEMLIARAERWFEVARIVHSTDRRWIVPVGNTIVVVTSTSEEPTRFACRVYSPSGEVIYDGPAQTVGPVGQRELEVLGLLLISLLLTIAVFVFRPAGAERVSVLLPASHALADPWKRILATSIDAGIAVVLSSWIWGTPLRAIVDLALAVTGDHGVWPIVTAGGILLVMSAVGEALTGRTLGKWMLGCRTVGSDGNHPSWGQALARNAVKTLCPPLAAVSLNVPGQQSPASFGTFVITRAGGPPADDARDQGSDTDSAPPA